LTSLYAVAGPQGFAQRNQLLQRTERLEQHVVRLDALRRRLSAEVAALDRADPDIVIEAAFETLGFVAAGDRVLVAP
jgi:cell division protein FtsB